jgi:aminoglycoside N3'-acetyltransferase
MVHSSVSRLQPVYEGSAHDLLDLLLRLAGPGHTLVMPAFFFGTAELFNRAYYREHPRFDARRTPSQMGLVTELFRRRRGVVRSLHPTHSVCALGPLAEKICATQHLSPWACGELSPFGVMGKHKTVILGLGVEYYRALTQVHCAEEMLADQFPVPRERDAPVMVELIDARGNKYRYEMAPPLSREYVLHGERLRQLLTPDDIEDWSFKGAALYITEAAKIDAAIHAAALRGESLYVRAPH